MPLDYKSLKFSKTDVAAAALDLKWLDIGRKQDMRRVIPPSGLYSKYKTTKAAT